MCIIMKCSDLSNEIRLISSHHCPHQYRPKQIANVWAQRINKEFFAQSDKEKELNLKVSAWMDYTKVQLLVEEF